MAAGTIETIQKLKFELLPQPAYSPDLALSDYHIFRLPIDSICRYQFANDVEVKGVVLMWLHM
jgi:hypothetical protein